jgi:hypothetical protein
MLDALEIVDLEGYWQMEMELLMHRNCIEDMEEVLSLSLCSSLKNASLDGNPIAVYFMCVVFHLQERSIRLIDRGAPTRLATQVGSRSLDFWGFSLQFLTTSLAPAVAEDTVVREVPRSECF